YFVVAPNNLKQLISAVRFFREQRIPYKTRGAGHSSGGQVLTDRGAILDLSLLTGIVKDDPDAEQITVETGTWWLEIAQKLHPENRRPIVLTDNFRTSVGGTLAVGGFGDTTHLYGLQIHSATSLSVVTADGEIHETHPGDESFQFVLAGR